jgi:hypothetical protein
MENAKGDIKQRIAEIEEILAREKENYLLTRDVFLTELQALTTDVVDLEELNEVITAVGRHGGKWESSLLPWPKYTDNVWQWGAELIIYDRETGKFRRYKEAAAGGR